jgi:peptidoglycan hydrolase-like protein with peptidoglycan-binding domain
MKTWTSALALTIAGTLLAGPALAQTGGTTGSGDTTKQPGMQQPTSPGTTGTPGGSDAAKPGAMKGESKAQAGAGNKEQVRAVQEVLKDRGMYEGEVDGIMGPKTQAALRAFQKKEGLQETGRLDQQTMGRLGVQKTGATDTTSPAASPSTTTPEQKDKPATGAAPEKSTTPGTSGSSATPGASGSSAPAKDSTKK